LAGCDDLEPKTGGEFHNNGSGEYPYYLAIGGGLSETLSVLRIDEGPAFKLYDDVALTGAAINQTVTQDSGFYAVCSLSNSVVVYDRDLQVQREVSLGAGANPMNLAFVDERTAWVSDFLADDVRLVDLGPGVAADQRLLATVAMPAGDDLPHDAGATQTWARPNGVAAVNGEVFVALSNLSATWTPGGPGQIAVIDSQERSLVDRITLAGRDPIGLTWDASRGVIWTASAGDYDEASGFVGNGTVEAIEPATHEIVARIDVEGAPFELTVATTGLGYLTNGRDGRALVVDLDAGEARAPLDLRRHLPPSGLSFISALALDPAGRLYAADFNSDYLYVLDPANDHAVIHEAVVNDGPDTLGFLP
jgi:DNA-binding beta-propeller fold protein YncE